MTNLRLLLQRYNVVPIIDPQVRHTCGKLRSLGLLLTSLDTKSLGCLRPRAVFTTFPGIKPETPSRRAECEFRSIVISQREEKSHGLVNEGMQNPPFIAVIDSHGFISKRSDRKLVPWVGFCLYYLHEYSKVLEERGFVPLLKDTKNLFFQHYAQKYKDWTCKENLELIDLFDPEDPYTAPFPWWKWLRRWAFLSKKYPWFRKSRHAFIERDIQHWIESRTIVNRIREILYYLLETKLDLNLQKITEWIEKREYDFSERYTKRNGQRGYAV